MLCRYTTRGMALFGTLSTVQLAVFFSKCSFAGSPCIPCHYYCSTFQRWCKLFFPNVSTTASHDFLVRKLSPCPVAFFFFLLLAFPWAENEIEEKCTTGGFLRFTTHFIYILGSLPMRCNLGSLSSKGRGKR